MQAARCSSRIKLMIELMIEDLIGGGRIDLVDGCPRRF
jgi:hypothetical protein